MSGLINNFTEGGICIDKNEKVLCRIRPSMQEYFFRHATGFGHFAMATVSVSGSK